MIAAFFDVDGTIAKTNIVRYYVHFQTRSLSTAGRALWILGYLPQVARWLYLDAIDRRRMNETFYRSYAGLDRDELHSIAVTDYPTLLGDHIFPSARAAIDAHRSRGERIVLVTGSLDFIIAPLAEAVGADDTIAVEMKSANGKLTGELNGPPLGEEAKAEAVNRYAEKHDIDLEKSFAYGDSSADIPVLSTVGNSIAVNPRGRLRETASRNGWRTVHWTLEGA